jgi:hypothetical protein
VTAITARCRSATLLNQMLQSQDMKAYPEGEVFTWAGMA